MNTQLIDYEPSPNLWSAMRARMHSERSFMACNWFAPWGRHFLPEGRWTAPLRYCVCSSDDGQPAGLYPFAVQSLSGLKFISLAGYYLPFRGIPVARDLYEEVCCSLADAFSNQKEGVALRLGLVQRHDPVVCRFLAELKKRKWRLHLLREGDDCTAHLPPTLEEFDALVGRNVRKKTARKERSMRQDGAFHIGLFTDLARSEWARVLTSLGSIERQSWRARKGGEMRFSGARNTRFWLDVLGDPRASQMTKVWIIFLNGEPVSHAFGFDSGSYRYILAISYAESVSRYRTGSIVFKYLFEDAIARGIEFLNLGLGDASYKRRWGAEPIQTLQDWIALRPGVLGGVISKLLRVRRVRRAGPGDMPSTSEDGG